MIYLPGSCCLSHAQGAVRLGRSLLTIIEKQQIKREKSSLTASKRRQENVEDSVMLLHQFKFHEKASPRPVGLAFDRSRYQNARKRDRHQGRPTWGCVPYVVDIFRVRMQTQVRIYRHLRHFFGIKSVKISPLTSSS